MIFRFETQVKSNDTVLRAFIKPQENPIMQVENQTHLQDEAEVPSIKSFLWSTQPGAVELGFKPVM